MPKDLMIIDDWTVLHTIVDPVSGNTEKFWLSPLPSFDLQTFPFVVSSGNNTFNVVNVKTGDMSVLINGSALNKYGQ